MAFTDGLVNINPAHKRQVPQARDCLKDLKSRWRSSLAGPIQSCHASTSRGLSVSASR